MGTGYTRADVSNNIADGNIINSSDLDNEYDAIEAAFNSSTGHTHDGTSAEGGPITVVGPVQDLVVSATEVKPKTTNTLDLGTSTLLYKDAYLQGNMYFRDTALKIVSSADGQLDIDADVEVEITAPTLDIDASTAVTIDTATLTITGSANVTGDLDIDNININGNTIISTNANGNIALTPNGTGEVDISKVDIDSGAIDGTVIGASSAAAITGTTITGTSFVTSGDMTFGDNDKAIFGAGSDLQIYHDGSNSYIDEQGTGNLLIRGTQIQLKASDGTSYAEFNDSGASNLRYSGDLKFATTSGGIDVIGTVTADGLTVDVTSTVGQTLHNSTGTSVYTRYQNNSGNDNYIGYTGNSFEVFPNNTKALAVASGGDISFYDSTGVTQGFFWDASTQRLGLGTTSPSAPLTVQGGTGTAATIQLNGGSAGNDNASIHSLYNLNFKADSSESIAGRTINFAVGTTAAMTINSSGNVGIGTSSPTTVSNKNLHVYAGAGQSAGLRVTGNAGTGFDIQQAADGYVYVYNRENTDIIIGTNNTERMRITSGGNVGIGTSPSERLHVSGGLLSTSNNNSADVVDGAIVDYFSGNTRLIASRSGATDAAIQFYTTSSGTLAERMRIDSSGNVGIGTSSLSANIHAKNASGNLEIRFDSDSARNIVFADNDGTYDAQIEAQANGTLYIATRQAQPIQFAINNSEKMRIDSSGITTVGGTSGSARLNAVAQNWPENALGIYSANISGQTNFAGIAFFNQDTDAAVGNVADIYTNPTGTLSLTSAANPAIQLKYGSAGISGGTAALTVDSSGNVGIGTTSPNVDLEVVDTFRVSRSGNSGTYFEIFGGSAANDPYLNVPSGFPMPFRIGGTEAMRIDSSGNVLVGSTTNVGTADHKVSIDKGTTGRNLGLGTSLTTATVMMSLVNGNGTVGTIQTNGTSTSYNTSSDYRLKENITDAVDAGDAIDAIQVRQFDWIADGTHQDYGMVAQELMTVAPEAVSGNPDSDEMMGVDYSKLVPMLIKEVQSLRARVAELENN